MARIIGARFYPFILVVMALLMFSFPQGVSGSPAYQETVTALPTETLITTLTPQSHEMCQNQSSIPTVEKFYTPTDISNTPSTPYTPTLTPTVTATTTGIYTQSPNVLTNYYVDLHGINVTGSCDPYGSGIYCDFRWYTTNNNITDVNRVFAISWDNPYTGFPTYYRASGYAEGEFAYGDPIIDDGGGHYWNYFWSVVDPYSGLSYGDGITRTIEFSNTVSGSRGYLYWGTRSWNPVFHMAPFEIWITPQPWVDMYAPTPTSTPECNTNTGLYDGDGEAVAYFNSPTKELWGCFAVFDPITVSLPEVSWSPFSLPSSVGFPGWQICIFLVTFSAKFGGVDWAIIIGGVVSAYAIAGIYTVLKNQ